MTIFNITINIEYHDIFNPIAIKNTIYSSSAKADNSIIALEEVVKEAINHLHINNVIDFEVLTITNHETIH